MQTKLSRLLRFVLPLALVPVVLNGFWQTGVFRVLTALAVLGVVVWAVKLLATRRLQQRLALLRQQHALETERTRIARDIHDELGAVLTGISLLSDRAQSHCRRQEQVAGDLETIARQARCAVQSLDGIVWAINPQNDTFDHLANYLVHFAEDFFRLTSIRCRLDVPENMLPATLGTQQRHDALLAVKEACNNVVRHSGASEVWVRMRTDSAGFYVSIEDNGRGFVPGTESEGSDGIRNMRHRAAEIGGRMELDSNQGQGTAVTFYFPLLEIHSAKCQLA